jgi:hypothetical protein
MEESKMNPIPSNSKIKYPLLSILFIILFILTALQFQHPVTTYARITAGTGDISDRTMSVLDGDTSRTNTTQNYKTVDDRLEDADANHTESSSGDKVSYLYWNSSTKRCGVQIYIIDNKGAQMATQIYLDDQWVDDTDEDYLNNLKDNQYGAQTNVLIPHVGTTTESIGLSRASYRSGIKTVNYTDAEGAYSLGSEVMEWLTTDSGVVLVNDDGKEYALPNWAYLVCQSGNRDTLKKFLNQDAEQQGNWHVFVEPITSCFIYTDDTFTKDTPAPSWCNIENNTWKAGDPIPRGKYDGDVYVPEVYTATATNFLMLIRGGSSHTKWLLQRQLPYSLCLEEDVDLTGIAALNYTLNASNPSTVTTLTYNSQDRVPNSTMYGGYIFSQGIGIASLEIDCFKEPLDTYWEDNGSPGDPEPTGDDKTGDCIIIKHYYKVTKTYDSDNNLKSVKYKHVTDKTEENTTNYVDVMDESTVSGYVLKQWVTSDTEREVYVPSNYDAEDGGTYTADEIKFKNTSGCKIVSTEATDPGAIESEQKYIILILVKEENNQEEIQLDDYFEITESTLTKRVNFSQVTLKLKEATFKWTRNQFDSKAA